MANTMRARPLLTRRAFDFVVLLTIKYFAKREIRPTG